MSLLNHLTKCSAGLVCSDVFIYSLAQRLFAVRGESRTKLCLRSYLAVSFAEPARSEPT